MRQYIGRGFAQIGSRFNRWVYTTYVGGGGVIMCANCNLMSLGAAVVFIVLITF